MKLVMIGSNKVRKVMEKDITILSNREDMIKVVFSW
jgi:hypothetical protein